MSVAMSTEEVDIDGLTIKVTTVQKTAMMQTLLHPESLILIKRIKMMYMRELQQI
jgi:hypothetical protein